METVQADLNIELNVTCPHCDEYFDLFDIDGGQLNEEGGLIEAACPEGYWWQEHKKYEEIVQCPECKKDVSIKGIVW